MKFQILAKDIINKSISNLPKTWQIKLANWINWIRQPAYVGRILVPDTYLWCQIYVTIAKLFAPRLYWQRRQPIHTTGDQSIALGIDAEKGYKVVEGAQHPKIQEAVDAACAIAENIDFDKSGVGHGNKPFLIQHRLDLTDPKVQPIFELACDDLFVGPITEYLGSLPVLMRASLLYSPNKEYYGRSQNFHLDGEDIRQIKCYIFLDEITKDCGPLTVLPAKSSRVVYDRLKKSGLTKVRNQKHSDEVILEACPEETPIPLYGRKGTVAFVDTCNCYHYGSRPTARSNRPRLLLALHYATAFSRELPVVGKKYAAVALDGNYSSVERERHRLILGLRHLCYRNL